MAETPLTWDQRILAALPRGVDPTLIAESLRLTPTERLERLQAMVAFVASVRAKSDHPVPSVAGSAGRG